VVVNRRLSFRTYARKARTAYRILRAERSHGGLLPPAYWKELVARAKDARAAQYPTSRTNDNDRRLKSPVQSEFVAPRQPAPQVRQGLIFLNQYGPPIGRPPDNRRQLEVYEKDRLSRFHYDLVKNGRAIYRRGGRPAHLPELLITEQTLEGREARPPRQTQ
jgi:hypothetical protein